MNFDTIIRLLNVTVNVAVTLYWLLLFGCQMQSQQISELLGIIERQGSHLDQYRSVLDAQRQSNTSLTADCERIQARYSLFSSTDSTRLALTHML